MSTIESAKQNPYPTARELLDAGEYVHGYVGEAQVTSMATLLVRQLQTLLPARAEQPKTPQSTVVNEDQSMKTSEFNSYNFPTGYSLKHGEAAPTIAPPSYPPETEISRKLVSAEQCQFSGGIGVAGYEGLYDEDFVDPRRKGADSESEGAA